MIYTRFGGQVKQIIANIGLVETLDKKNLLNLLIIQQDEKMRAYYAEVLKADDGWEEIQKAIELAPRMTLSFPLLQAAKKDAE